MEAAAAAAAGDRFGPLCGGAASRSPWRSRGLEDGRTTGSVPVAAAAFGTSASSVTAAYRCRSRSIPPSTRGLGRIIVFAAAAAFLVDPSGSAAVVAVLFAALSARMHRLRRTPITVGGAFSVAATSVVAVPAAASLLLLAFRGGRRRWIGRLDRRAVSPLGDDHPQRRRLVCHRLHRQSAAAPFLLLRRCCAATDVFRRWGRGGVWRGRFGQR
jgi:hypothetical protein